MNTEILQIAEQLKDAYEGDPWFGRSIKSLLKDVEEDTVFEKPNGEHSIVELLWHIINWRAFTINRIREGDEVSLKFFEANDWRHLGHHDKSLWKKGLHKLNETQSELVAVIQHQQDSILDETVPGRNYSFKKMLYGIVQHDIYHAGQIAYLTKMLRKKS
jgi:uncharacterized damage-inducible protein DinB